MSEFPALIMDEINIHEIDNFFYDCDLDKNI